MYGEEEFGESEMEEMNSEAKSSKDKKPLEIEIKYYFNTESENEDNLGTISDA